MKLKNNILGIALASVALASCSDKMEYNEYTAYDHDYIARNDAYVGGFMSKIYNDIDTDWGNLNGAMLASATDEAVFSHDGNSVEDFLNGNWSAVNPHQTIWASAYEGITYCNEMLSNWKGLEFEQFKYCKDYEGRIRLFNNYQYEARWARAYFYFTLVRQYGAVPFKTVNTNGAEESALPCTPSDDIFNFINDECDAIKDSIVADYVALSKTAPIDGVKSQTGRANRCAVLALKAQAALYHASPLFSQGKTAEQKAELWRQAALANKELIEACEAAGKGLAVSLDTLWTPAYITDVQADKEIIFARRTAVANTLEANNFPVGYSSGQGGNCPTQDLVDAFECIDGKSITESTLYDPQNPYENRDPRLKKTVAVNGELWPSDLEAYNSAYPTLQTYEGGYHSRTGAAAGASYATPTGYYLKKLCNGNQILRARSGKAVTTSGHGWMTFRMGGMYLNYAEAVFQYFKALGNDNAADAVDATFTKSARALASMTRTRSNMPQFPVGLSNAEFWAKYKNERRVELAFEGHRFYDVRRWMEDGDKFMVVHAANITLGGDGNLVFGTPKTIVRGGGTWQEKWNLFPFSQSEILKSKNAIKQNEGW